jgi:hypothetical protein
LTTDRGEVKSPRKVTVTELLRMREERWSARIRGCSLVAELEVEERHGRQVAQALGRFYSTQRGSPRSEHMFTRWPACSVIALTGIAASSYRQGELWPELWDGVGYHGDQKDQGIWGRGFLAAIHELGMPSFPELPMPYVGPILMHTGIPSYCLDDYFRLIVHRRATEPGLVPEDFLEWAIERPRRLGTLDMPARRFLEYGTEYALDFVERTFDLLDRLRDPASDFDGVGLSQRVMVKAHELVSEGILNLQAEPATSPVRQRAERPRISLDPFGRGIEVILPPVSDTPDGFARWSVTADGVTTTIRSQAAWAGVTEAAPTTAFTLLQPVRSVVIMMDGSTDQTELQVVHPDAPMLVFSEDGRRLAATMPLPPDVVWIAHPDEHELTVDGPLSVAIEGQLPLGWNGWRLRQIRLDGVRSLELRGILATRRLVRGHTRPRIITGQPTPGVTTPYGTPVYAQVPEIWLPGDAGAHTVWTVDIRSSSDSATIASQTYPIDKPRMVTDPWDRLPRPLLGSFTITVRGPLGRGASRTVFLAERLEIQYTPQVRLFDHIGLTRARAELKVPVGARADPAVVTFEPSERAGIIEYRAGQETEPLVISPPHLEVMHERADQALVWSAGSLRIPADAFSEDPGALLVRVPQAKSLPALQIVVGDRVVQNLPPSGAPREGMARFGLTRIADTVAEHQRAELVLDVGVPVRLVTVRPRQLAVGAERDGDRIRLIDFVPIDGLTVGIYMTSAPWRKPLTRPVEENGTVTLPNDLQHAGSLLVALQVEDPWVPAEWPRWPGRHLFVAGEGYLSSESSEETSLSRFVTGTGEFPDRISDLQRIWTLVHLARRLRLSSETQRFLATCSRPLLQRPSEAIRALGDLGLEPESTLSAVISSGLAATALPNSANADVARKLWPTAPLLAVLNGNLRDPECFDAAERQCGGTLENIVRSGTDRHAVVGRFGLETERMIRMDLQQVESIWRAAQVVPHAVLDPDTRAAAARRLFDRRGDGDIKKVGAMATSAVNSSLTLLSGRPHLRAQIEARRHPAGRGGWFAIPAASAGFAIIARLAARGDMACRNAEQHFRADWMRLATAAPDLVVIDLILAELLVSSTNTEAQ